MINSKQYVNTEHKRCFVGIFERYENRGTTARSKKTAYVKILKGGILVQTHLVPAVFVKKTL